MVTLYSTRPLGLGKVPLIFEYASCEVRYNIFYRLKMGNINLRSEEFVISKTGKIYANFTKDKRKLTWRKFLLSLKNVYFSAQN